MSDAKVRLIGNASVTRYDRGEGTISEILDGYNLVPDDRVKVEDYIRTKRPEMFPAA